MRIFIPRMVDWIWVVILHPLFKDNASAPFSALCMKHSSLHTVYQAVTENKSTTKNHVKSAIWNFYMLLQYEIVQALPSSYFRVQSTRLLLHPKIILLDVDDRPTSNIDTECTAFPLL